MPEFNTFDLGRVIQTAEAIKGMRRQAETDRLQQAYLGQRMQSAAAQEQREATTFSQEQQIANTKLLNAAAAEVAQNPAAASRWIPQLQQAGILRPDVDLSQIPPEQLQEAAREIFDSTSAALAALSGPQEIGPLETIVGPDGRPIMVPRSMAVGQQPFQRNDAPASYEEFIRAQKDPEFAQFLRERRNQGLSVTLPDGTEITAGGSPFALPKPTQNQLGEAYTQSIAGMQRLQSMVASFDPRFLTYGGKFKGMWSSIKAKTPEVFGQLSPEDRDYLARYQTWSSDTLDNLNRYIKDITGASMSVQEAERIKASVPNADDDPISFQSKLNTTMKRLSLVAARSAYLLSNPAQSISDISLDRMQAIITDRANALYAGYLQQGLNEQEARQRALTEARSQFGLGDGATNQL